MIHPYQSPHPWTLKNQKKRFRNRNLETPVGECIYKHCCSKAWMTKQIKNRGWTLLFYWVDPFSKKDSIFFRECFFRFILFFMSSSVHLPYYLQHLGAGSCQWYLPHFLNWNLFFPWSLHHFGARTFHGLVLELRFVWDLFQVCFWICLGLVLNVLSGCQWYSKVPLTSILVCIKVWLKIYLGLV
jgi:hypothetical protein